MVGWPGWVTITTVDVSSLTDDDHHLKVAVMDDGVQWR